MLERQIFSDLLTASVMHFVVLREKRMSGYGLRLLKAFEQWARNRKAMEIGFGITGGFKADAVCGFARNSG